jgi:hypothetical protein
MKRSSIRPYHAGSVDIDLPLDPETDNGEDVAQLVQRILLEIETLTAGRSTTQHDIVQALSIATALHAALGEVKRQTGQAPSLDLLDVQVGTQRLN